MQHVSSVKFENIQKRTELNGRSCTVDGSSQKGRLIVKYSSVGSVQVRAPWAVQTPSEIVNGVQYGAFKYGCVVFDTRKEFKEHWNLKPWIVELTIMELFGAKPETICPGVFFRYKTRPPTLNEVFDLWGPQIYDTMWEEFVGSVQKGLWV